MRIECLQRKNPADGKEILAGFLRSLMAVARYGRTTIYEGDTYYIPYTMVTYLVEETKEQYRFLASEVSEDISVFREDEKNAIELISLETEEKYLVPGTKEETKLLEEVEKKIRLNKKMRKMFKRYHFTMIEIKTIYLPEQTFYGRGKKDNLFLVDQLLQKVDFKNLSSVETCFARNFLNETAGYNR